MLFTFPFPLRNDYVQAFVKTAATIYKKLQDGVLELNGVSQFIPSWLCFQAWNAPSNLDLIYISPLLDHIYKIQFNDGILFFIFNFFCCYLQHNGIQVGNVPIPGLSGGGSVSSQVGGCCSWYLLAIIEEHSFPVVQQFMFILQISHCNITCVVSLCLSAFPVYFTVN